MRRGFTLVELLVVITMIAILAAAFTSSVNAARKRAMASRATQEMKEMTNAILGYEQYAEEHSLDSVKTGTSWQPCTESAMQMILGGKSGANGKPIPVLYNGHVRQGNIRDPWGKPYEYRIQDAGTIEGGGKDEAKNLSLQTAAALPNYFRLTDEERR